MRVLPVSDTIIIPSKPIFDHSESSITQNPGSLMCAAHYDQSHVVLTRLAAGEILDCAQHGKQRAACGRTTGTLCRSRQPFRTELGSVFVSALRDAIGIAQQCVPRP